MMKHATLLGFFLTAISFSTTVAAFNNEKCGNLFPKSDGAHRPWFSPLYISTMGPSTTSYFSSFGPCSMYAGDGYTPARQSFLDESLAPLKVDAARGKGEYINALAELSGCPSDKFGKFGSVLQNHYSKVFSEQNSSSILSQVDQVVNSEPELKGSCRPIALNK